MRLDCAWKTFFKEILSFFFCFLVRSSDLETNDRPVTDGSEALENKIEPRQVIRRKTKEKTASVTL